MTDSEYLSPISPKNYPDKHLKNSDITPKNELKKDWLIIKIKKDARTQHWVHHKIIEFIHSRSHQSNRIYTDTPNSITTELARNKELLETIKTHYHNQVLAIKYTSWIKHSHHISFVNKNLEIKTKYDPSYRISPKEKLILLINLIQISKLEKQKIITDIKELWKSREQEYSPIIKTFNTKEKCKYAWTWLKSHGHTDLPETEFKDKYSFIDYLEIKNTTSNEIRLISSKINNQWAKNTYNKKIKTQNQNHYKNSTISRIHELSKKHKIHPSKVIEIAIHTPYLDESIATWLKQSTNKIHHGQS